MPGLAPSSKNVNARLARVTALASFAIVVAVWPAHAEGWQHVGNVQHVEKLPDGVELTAGSTKVRITAFRDGVIRVRVAPQGSFPKDCSWAVIESPEVPPVKMEAGKDDMRITAGRVIVIIHKSPLLITFADAQGRVILADEPSLPMAWDGQRIHIWKRMPPDENYFGLGDKAGSHESPQSRLPMWNTDFFGWQESNDPLYKTIPFFIGLRKGTAYGVFFDNTYRSSFDFGKESPDYFSFGAEGGELNYYFIRRPRTQENRRSNSPRWSAARLFRRSGRSATSRAATATIPKRAPAKSCRPFAKRRFPPTSFISTSTISRAMRPSPSIANISRISKK